MAKETLWDQLNKIFLEVLPEGADKAVNGTQLLEMVKPKLAGKYSDDSIRSYFSDMAYNPNTTISKKSTGNGYYRKAEVLESNGEAPQGNITSDLNSQTVQILKEGGRDETPEEKFRAIYMRYSELSSLQFSIKIEHTEAKKGPSGQHVWKFPDVVLVRWNAGMHYEDATYKLDSILLESMKGLGEPVYTLQSVELKTDLYLSSVRENFFQCLSNSKWAHRATLAVAADVDDAGLRSELERLGGSYDVSIVTYGLSKEKLKSFPNAKDIRKMERSKFEQDIASAIKESRISNGREKGVLDWETIKDLKSLSPDFERLFEWIAECLTGKKAYSYEDFLQISRIKKRA